MKKQQQKQRGLHQSLVIVHNNFGNLLAFNPSMTFCSAFFLQELQLFIVSLFQRDLGNFIDFNNQNSVIKYVEHVVAYLKLLMYNNEFEISLTFRVKEIVLMTTIS